MSLSPGYLFNIQVTFKCGQNLLHDQGRFSVPNLDNLRNRVMIGMTHLPWDTRTCWGEGKTLPSIINNSHQEIFRLVLLLTWEMVSLGGGYEYWSGLEGLGFSRILFPLSLPESCYLLKMGSSSNLEDFRKKGENRLQAIIMATSFLFGHPTVVSWVMKHSVQWLLNSTAFEI